MLNQEILSVSIPALSPADSVAQARDLMEDCQVGHLPVVGEGKFLGLVSEDLLLNSPDDDTPLAQIQPGFLVASVQAGNHILETIHQLTRNNLDLIPVVAAEGEYLGLITAGDLLRETGRLIGANDTGAILVLEMPRVNFSFSEISKLVETNDAQITQLNTSHDKETDVYLVTLRINKLEISDIVATFQRYEYKVRYFFGEESYENELRNNYNHLMNYLSI